MSSLTIMKNTLEEIKIPIHSYKSYSVHILKHIHTADQWLPLLSIVYVLMIFFIYFYQVASRISTFDPNIIPIHYIALSCLLITLLYCVLLFIESHDDTLQIAFLQSCHSTIRIHLMSLVVLKYFTTWIFIFNLSYMNQSPFFNPRYKYITKKRRKFLHYLFLSFKWIIGIFLPIGTYSAYIRAQYDSFHSAPDNFEYCYMTFNLGNFFIVFGTDILGVILYGLLFGRNACKLTQRRIKKHALQADVNAHSVHTVSQYDIDDPIQKSLILNTTVGSGHGLVFRSPIHEDIQCSHHSSSSEDNDECNREIPSLSGKLLNGTSHTASLSHLSKSGTTRREASVFSGAEDNVRLQEQKGMRELTRVLRLIWFMFISYWTNVLLYVFLGLYTSSASIALMVNATCILLLNDYEFSSTYWLVRSDISTFCCCCCIIWCDFWIGERKFSSHIPKEGDDDYECFEYDDDTVYSGYDNRHLLRKVRRVET